MSLRRIHSVLFILITLVTPTQGQLVWQRSPENPVVPVWAGGDYALSPSVIFDSTRSIFKMWFSGKIFFEPWTVMAAMSEDGTTWYSLLKNPILTAGGSGSFDAAGVAHPCVVRDESGYKMYYEGIGSNGVVQIGLAVSEDGVQWAKLPNNPVISTVPSSWESAVCSAPKVVIENGVYKMLYRGYDGTNHRIGFATSTDGVSWTKHASNPVLQAGPPGSWDQGGALTNSLFVYGGTMFLFYHGAPGSPSMGLATSPDGVNWTKYSGNPVFIAGGQSWENRIDHGSVMLKDGTLHLWYSGNVSYWQIGYATSPFTILDVHETITEKPLDFSLSNSYPNPFNPETRFSFSLPRMTRVTIKVYDSLGKDVATLLDDVREAGTHKVTWNAAQYSSGVYWYRMTAGPFSDTKKVTLLK